MTQQFDNLCNKITYNQDSQKSGGLFRTSWTASQYPDHFAGGLVLRRQLNCSPTDKKRKTKKPPLRIFENFFCLPAFGTFAFALFLFFKGMGKGKRAKFSQHTLLFCNFAIENELERN
jgi:hypothetical protein